MNPQGILARLNELRVKCMECVSEMDKQFEDLDVWKESVRKDVAMFLSNKKRKLIVPTTPAGIRKRVCLPVIDESVEIDSQGPGILVEKGKEVSVTFNIPRRTRSCVRVQCDNDSNIPVSNSKISKDLKNQESIVSGARISANNVKEVKVSVRKLSEKHRKSSTSSKRKSVSKANRSKSLKDTLCFEDENQTTESTNISKEVIVKDIDVNMDSESNFKKSLVKVSSEQHSLDTQNTSFVTAASLNETYDVRNSENNLRNSTSTNMFDKENHALKDFHGQNKNDSPTKKLKSPCLFSPYGNESVKKRVAAYENLYKTSEEIKTTKRVTRSKARALFQDNTSSNHNNKNLSLMKITASNKPGAKRHLNKKHEVSKENSMLNSSKKSQFTTGTKVLTDVNRLHTSQSQLNSSKKTLLPRVVLANVCLTGELMNSVNVPITMETEGQSKNTFKQSNYEIKKIEEFMKKKEKEKEAIHRREELLKKRAEEQRKKKEEKRLKVMQKREAQEKEKHENQLRAGRERDEKLNILLQERDIKLKEEILKKKLESERKATEVRRKVEEAEATRLAKLKMEEQIRKKELQEAEAEQKRRHAEEKEEALQREKVLKGKDAPKGKPEASVKNLDSTFTMPSTKNCPNKISQSSNNTKNNVYNLEDLSSGESDDDDDSDDGAYKLTAIWANRARLYWESRLDLMLPTKIFGSRKFDVSSVFTNLRNFKRTSSAQWNTPPRYSCLPHY